MLWGWKAVNPRIRESINGRLTDKIPELQALLGFVEPEMNTVKHGCSYMWSLCLVVPGARLQGLNRMYLVFECGMEFKGLSHIWRTTNHTFHCSILTESFKAFLLGLGGRCCFTGGPTAQSDVHLRPCLAPPLLTLKWMTVHCQRSHDSTDGFCSRFGVLPPIYEK